MNRVFICGYFNFPRGGAASNYVQYFAKVFMAMKKEVIVISNINYEVCSAAERYQGVRLEPIQVRKNKIGHYIDYNFRMGNYYERQLNKHSLDSQDIIIAYSRDASILKSILLTAKKTGAKAGVCLVEWFEKKDFDKGILNPVYWSSQYAFYALNKKFDFIFPISTYIDEYYRSKKCNTFCIPCLADTSEFGFAEKIVGSKKIFIFPGNGKMKDALNEMLKAISMLSEEEIHAIEFHICGVSKFAKQAVQGTKLEQYLDKEIVIHDWMSYEKLVALYKKTHFMLLARNISRMTLANFPSKIPETLSYGIIPICSRVGDYTELYLKNGENSLILDGCDENTIVSGIRRALQMTHNDITEYSIRCRKTAEERFDYKNWVEPMRKFIESKET